MIQSKLIPCIPFFISLFNYLLLYKYINFYNVFIHFHCLKGLLDSDFDLSCLSPYLDKRIYGDAHKVMIEIQRSFCL